MTKNKKAVIPLIDKGIQKDKNKLDYPVKPGNDKLLDRHQACTGQ